MKVKAFSAGQIWELEHDINTWLASQPDNTAIWRIVYQIATDGTHFALLQHSLVPTVNDEYKPPAEHPRRE